MKPTPRQSISGLLLLLAASASAALPSCHPEAPLVASVRHDIVAYSPDRREFIARPSPDSGIVTLYDATTSRPIQTYRGGDPFTDFQFSSDGRYILGVSSTNGSAWLWDRRTARVVVHRDDGVTAGELSPRGDHVLLRHGWYDTFFSLLVAESGAQRMTLRGKMVRFADGGRTLVSETEVAIDTWELDSMAHSSRPKSSSPPTLVPNRGHPQGATVVAFSPDGREIATGGADGTVRFWSLDGRETGRLVPNGTVKRLEYSPDGRLVLTSGSGGANLWDRGGASLRKWKVDAAQFAADGRQVLLGGTFSQRVPSIHDVAAGADVLSLGERVTTPSYSPHQDFIIGRGESHARVFRSSSAEPLAWLNDLRLPSDAFAFSDDDRSVLVFAGDVVTSRAAANGAESWRVAIPGLLQNKFVRWLTGNRFFVTASWFSPPDDWFARTTSLRVWDADARTERAWIIPLQVSLWDFAVPPIADQLLVRAGGPLQLRDAATGAVLVRFEGPAPAPTEVKFSRDGRYAVAPGGPGFLLWDARTGKLLQQSERAPYISRIAFSKNRRLLAFTAGDEAFFWDLDVGREVARVTAAGASRGHIAVSDDGMHVALSTHNKVIVYSRSGQLKTVIPYNFISGFRFSQDGRFLFANSGEQLWTFCFDLAMRRPCSGRTRFPGHLMVLSPAGDRLLFHDSFAERGEVLDPRTQRRVAEFKVPFRPAFGRFASASSRFFAVSGLSGAVTQWYETATGKPVTADVAGEAGKPVTRPAAPQYPSDLTERIAIGSSAGMLTLTQTKPERRVLAHLGSFPDGAWAVTDPSGRFDTDLDRASLLSWQVEGKAAPLPVEVYSRAYFEPRLLPRLLAGEPLPEIAPVTHLSTVRPRVEITSVRPVTRDLVEVSIQLAPESASEPLGPVHDVRLFRDGQLVARHPAPQQRPACRQSDAVERWRCETLVPEAEKTHPITFRVRVSVRDDIEDVDFAAYAFNRDRIKSPTARAPFQRPKEWARRPERRAHVLAIGVGSNDNLVHFGLTHPEKDARDLVTALEGRLTGFTGPKDVVLLTDPNGPAPVNGAPTKRAIRSEIVKLARRAAAEDLVVIYFSGHGVRDERGEFYLVPSDMPAGDPKSDLDRFLPHAISSTELTGWLVDIDAARVVLIIDACHSGALTEGSGFKPGPMGDASFGQLAFDKSIQVLAATQPQSLATTANRGRSLLTDVLIHDCLSSSKTLSLALACAAKAVPERQQREERTSAEGSERQVPALFDSGRVALEVPLKAEAGGRAR
ncbi:caspase family protein [Sorangium sp. So ce185]|uniref:caspase family protein n=1 Tax=Sorangium sp. So ce185 TaxID=3133287 RepID=UPI003F606263